MDAPKVIVNTTSVTVDDVELELEPWFRAGEHVAFLHDLAFVLENKRELWLHVHAGATFPGVSALFLDGAKRGGLFKSVVYTLALAGYPNVLLVVANADGTLATLPFDGRVPGLARWREPADASTLSTELRPDGSVLLGPELAGDRGSRAPVSLDELPAAIVSRWALLAGSSAAAPDAPDHRAVLRFANDTPYATIVRLADAVSEAKRTFPSDDGPSEWPAFVPTLGASAHDLDEFRESRGRDGRSNGAEQQRHPARGDVPANVDERVLSFFLGLNAGVRGVDMRSLDRAFQADGFGTLPETVAPVGGTLDGGISRWRVSLEFAGWRASTRNRNDGSKLNVSLFTANMTLGYDLLRFRRSTLFAATGVAGGDFGVGPRLPGVTRHSTGLEPTETDGVVYTYWLMPFELGFEHLVPLSRSSTGGWGVLFGIRGGGGVRLGGRWHADKENFSGPRFDGSGLEGRLVLGVGAFSVRGQPSGD